MLSTQSKGDERQQRPSAFLGMVAPAMFLLHCNIQAHRWIAKMAFVSLRPEVVINSIQTKFRPQFLRLIGAHDVASDVCPVFFVQVELITKTRVWQ